MSGRKYLKFNKLNKITKKKIIQNKNTKIFF